MASGLKEAFKNAATAIFKASGTIKETVTYRSRLTKNPTYDPNTNLIVDSYQDYENIEMIFTRYKIEETDDKTVLATDEKAKCLFDDLDDLNIIPQMHDEIIRVEKQIDGSESDVTWDIVDKYKDPADAVWTFQIRKP